MTHRVLSATLKSSHSVKSLHAPTTPHDCISLRINVCVARDRILDDLQRERTARSHCDCEEEASGENTAPSTYINQRTRYDSSNVPYA